MAPNCYPFRVLTRLSRSNFVLPFALPLLLLVVAGFAWHPLAGGDDFWAHASIGRWIVEHHQIPRRTLFLWSDSVPWIAHAWGTGVFFYALMRLGGAQGGPYLAQLFNLLMCAIPFVLLWRLWRKTMPYSSLMPVLFVTAMWAGAARFHARPELFTALFLTLLYLFLLAWPHQKQVPSGQILGILLMFALWPNLHGAVLVGLVILWATALIELMETRGDNRLLFIAALCTLLVFVCNPRGFEYYRVFLPVASKTFQKIDEWKPFWKWPALAPELVVAEAIVWCIGMLLWVTNPNKRWAQLGWMLLMGAAFLQARRQLWLTSITSLVVIVTNAQGLQSDALFLGWRRLTRGNVNERLPAPMRLIARVGVLIILVCAVCQAISKDFWPIRATSKLLPVHMAAFLKNQAPPGRILNDYEYSSYLEWALHDKRKLYIDLNNAYSDSLMDEYFTLIASSKEAALLAAQDKKRGRILDERRVRVVALRPYTKKEGLLILAKYLDHSAAWKRVYSGKDGKVWARN